MGSFLEDLRFASKLLLKDKTFNLVALLTLALCIGANTAIFSVLNSVLLRPLPFPESDRLVEVYNSYPNVGVEKGGISSPDYFDRRKETDTFEEAAAFQGRSFNVGVDGSPQRIDGLAATPSYFRVLRVQPVRGRIFTEEEGARGNDRVAILSEGLWQELYGGAADAIGQDIRLSGEPYRIVGVVKENSLTRDVRLWVPLSFSDRQMTDEARHSNNWALWARLQPGVSLEQAQQRVDATNKALEEIYPPNILELVRSAGYHATVVWLQEETVKDVRSMLWILQGAVGFVLLIGCVNVANLLLVRSNVRLKELSVRSALGAGRWRLSRLLLTESVLLGAAGGVLGFGIGIAGVRFLRYLGADRLPRAEEITVDLSVLAFAVGVAVVTGLLFGTIPVIHVLRANLADVFRQTGRTGTSHRPALFMRAVLVITQVALAFVLLVGSGLMISSFLRASGVDPGFDPENVLTARLALPDSRYPDDSDVRSFNTRLLEAVRTLPGVRHAGINNVLPFGGQMNNSVIMIEGETLAPGELPPVPTWARVNEGYFAAMGIPLLAGRTIRDTDGPDSPEVVVIDSFLRERYFPGSDPVGRRILPDVDPNATPFTIVGVVGSVKNDDLTDADPKGTIYYSYQQMSARGYSIVVKQDQAGVPLTAPIRAEVLRLDPELPLYDVRMLIERVEDSLIQRRATLWLTSMFAGLALLLSAIGIYGVLAYAVSQRTQEIGIRMALGAESGSLLRSVAGQGLKLAGIGLAIGLVGAAYLSRFAESQLYEVAPIDPTVYAGVAAVLACAALLASLIPSFRATRIHPAKALRQE